MPSHKHKPVIAFSVTNCICYDQRVLKMADTVSSLGCEIVIIGREKGDCCTLAQVPFKTRRFRMLFKSGFLFYKFFNIRLLLYLLFHRIDILVANDLDTLLPNFLVSKIKSIPLVYDSHEYFTEMAEVQNRKFVKMVWTLIEKSIFPKIKYAMTVSEPISSDYEKLYNIKPLVIRNLSRNASCINPFKREDLNLRPDDLIVIIQGTGINKDKGAEELIEAVKISEGVSLLVVGSGDVLPHLKEQVVQMNIEQNVRFIPVLPWEELMKYTKTADIGMCLEKDTNLSYRYSLPNKLFDYIAAGIPILAGDLPETGKILRENGCGKIIGKVNSRNISQALSELKANTFKLKELKKNSITASSVLNWEIECEKVKDFYNKILICEDLLN